MIKFLPSFSLSTLLSKTFFTLALTGLICTAYAQEEEEEDINDDQELQCLHLFFEDADEEEFIINEDGVISSSISEEDVGSELIDEEGYIHKQKKKGSSEPKINISAKSRDGRLSLAAKVKNKSYKKSIRDIVSVFYLDNVESALKGFYYVDEDNNIQLIKFQYKNKKYSFKFKEVGTAELSDCGFEEGDDIPDENENEHEED